MKENAIKRTSRQGEALALPVHWIVIGRIRTIPDTVDDFTGYRIGLDLFAWDAPGFENVKTFHSAGKARVRNVTLPAIATAFWEPSVCQAQTSRSSCNGSMPIPAIAKLASSVTSMPSRSS